LCKESWEASRELALEKGVFPRWEESSFAKKKDKVRNVAITTIAPTGTISMVADTSLAELSQCLRYRTLKMWWMSQDWCIQIGILQAIDG
jgi:ribonucleotide reductase alpha subunit